MLGVPPVDRDGCAQETSVLSDRALKNNEMTRPRVLQILTLLKSENVQLLF